MIFGRSGDAQEKRNKIRRAEACLAKIADGDTFALGDLYALVKCDLFALALSRTGNKSEAEQILRDTFVQIYRYAGHYPSKGKPMLWLFDVEKNLLERHLEIKKETAAAAPQVPAMRSGGEENIGDRLLRELTDTLDCEEYPIVALRLVSGLGFREIAALVSRPVVTVAACYRRAALKAQTEAQRETGRSLAEAFKEAVAAETPDLREQIERICRNEAQLPAGSVIYDGVGEERSLLVKRSLILFGLVFLFLCGVCVGYFMPKDGSGQSDAAAICAEERTDTAWEQ